MGAKRWIGWVLMLGAILWQGCAPGSDKPVMPTDSTAAAFMRSMKTAYQQGNMKLALSLADSADRYEEGLPDVNYTRGVILTTFRQYKESNEALKRVLDRDPFYPRAWYALGHNAFAQQQYRSALTYYKKEQELVRRLVDDKSARAKDLGPGSLPTITAQIGRTYYRMGVMDSSRMAYEEALLADSTLAVANAWLSEWYENQGQNEIAFQLARKAIRFDPGNLEYIFRLGNQYLLNGYPKEAVPFLGLVVQKWPGHEGATYNLGRALKAAGKEEEGQFYLDRVAHIQQLQEKALVAERGVDTFPSDPERWITLANLMVEIGYLDKAEMAFQVAHSLKPADMKVTNDMANLALVRGDTTLAIQRYQNLLQQDSTFVDGWLNLGIVYALKGQKDQAAAAWQRVLQVRPGDKDARRYLAGLSKTRTVADR